jgi:hypothetical protein
MKSVLLFFCILCASNAFSQSYKVEPIGHFVVEYKDKHKIIFDYIRDHPEWTLEYRTSFYENAMKKLRDEFIANRKAEYESKSIQLSVSNSCTSKSSGGKKNCGWNCVTAPDPNLYTQTSWMKVVGDSKGIKASNNGNSACLKMTVSGKGRNKGTLHATFRYHPDNITTLVDQDLHSLLSQIN